MSAKPVPLKWPVPKDGEVVWWVPSRSRPAKPRTVDLERYSGNGACDCPDFQFNREPWLSRGAKPSSKYECFHIRWAKRAFAKMKLHQVMAARGTLNQKENGP